MAKFVTTVVLVVVSLVIVGICSAQERFEHWVPSPERFENAVPFTGSEGVAEAAWKRAFKVDSRIGRYAYLRLAERFGKRSAGRVAARVWAAMSTEERIEAHALAEKLAGPSPEIVVDRESFEDMSAGDF